MTYDQAVKYAFRLGENNLWIFKDEVKDSYEVIRLVDGVNTYLHYCQYYTPVAHIELSAKIIEGPMNV